MGLRPDQEEERLGLDRGLGLRGEVAQHEVLEPPVAAAAHDLAAEPHLDVGRRLDLPHQVVRHAGAQRRGPDHERDRPCVAGEVQRGLPGRVGPAHDVDVVAHESGRFRGGAAVVHAGTVQVLELRDLDAAIAGAHGEEHRPRADGFGVRQRDDELVAVPVDARDRVHEREVGAEDPRLLVGRPGESPAADPAGEAEVVPDQRAGGGLAADAPAVDDERGEPLRRAVHGGRQARRPGADHHDVEGSGSQVHRTSRSGRDLGVVRVLQHITVGQHHQRQLRPVTSRGDERSTLVGVGEAEAVRDRALLEGFSQLVGSARP